MFNPDFYPTPPEVAATTKKSGPLDARYARIKGQVLPEQHRRPKQRRKYQEVAA